MEPDRDGGVGGAHASRWAIQALVHPVTLTCMAVLLLNDRMFKAQWPGWLTASCQTSQGWRSSRCCWRSSSARCDVLPDGQSFASIVVTGTWFVALKTVPAVAGATADLVTAVSGHPAHIVVDPSDLLVLPAMAWAMRAWRPPPLRPHLTAQQLAVLLVGAFLSLGTSYVCYEGPRDLTVRGQTVVAHVR